jgi:hypothetical protein
MTSKSLILALNGRFLMRMGYRSEGFEDLFSMIEFAFQVP